VAVTSDAQSDDARFAPMSESGSVYRSERRNQQLKFTGSGQPVRQAHVSPQRTWDVEAQVGGGLGPSHLVGLWSIQNSVVSPH